MAELTKEQKKIVADLYSSDDEVVNAAVDTIREVGGEFCIAPLIEIFFSTPFVEVRQNIGRVFVDIKSTRVSNAIIENFAKYIDHELSGDFISNLWQSSVVFDDVTLFVEKFVKASDLVALDCLSLVENNLGNISDESIERSKQIINSNLADFGDVKRQLAEDLLQILSSDRD